MRDDLTAALLTWYDGHARDLPWRVPPGSGRRPDPYRVWLSEIMLQQTTVAAVRAYFLRFTEIWPTVTDLAAAEDTEVMGAWAGLGYYARARNLLKCARVVASEHGGRFPDTEAGLLTLPGIGPYTAAAIAAIAFDRPAVVVDGNVERVMARLRRIETPLPAAKAPIRAAMAELTPDRRPGDYAQAVMDLGATICTPKSPGCMLCPWRDACAARLAGVAETLPVKAPKKAKPTRRGLLYLARRGDTWLLEQRPDEGLLGGMLAFPTSDWSEAPTPAPPALADWYELGEVRHTFTHFHLILTVLAADRPGPPSRGAFAPLDPSTLPTVFRKAHALMTKRHGTGD
ncbi:A/G-specific adenine glycosylase [Jannaschia seohaensis]|uniref:Adenine DNA glycosylase n=1 Tax=Jannaschia seohaensis TaxID=475081 RepID=A0A2Y9ASZ3_9RHOB|nr:A/G-specific adenine glycosylase [Jannaschia seohaensis]PWJ17431.1 A/G-specific adenine glycosylase [Jannaschia seohaensis]SSA47494.1 A/G-specific adenine glycosylase [Jannaschia seohaensis]